jgi:hypothetical protein
VTTIEVPQAVVLKGIPDVELVAVGSWDASTGPVTVTDDDLRQAVAALDCPGVHKPVLKLGHDEPDPDAQHMRWDGTPAVGWVSNMRMSANGAKVLGDYTGMPAWLADAAPSAYPQRSVEIQRQFRCQIGHTHPFVITAVSLLGIYPPAVGVIRSLNDVQALYTLAAADGHPPAEVTRSIAVRLATPTETRRTLTAVEEASRADFDRDRDEWEQSIADLLQAYGIVQRRQREQLTAQIAPLVDQGRYEELADLFVDARTAADTIYTEMFTAAQLAIASQVAEAAAQGVTGLTAVPDELFLRRVADGIASTMASTLAATAGRDAAQLAAPGASGAVVAGTVEAKLSDLSDRFLRDQFGGAIGAARMSGRYEVLEAAPTGEYYAAEVNDTSTCAKCKAVDGRRFDTLDDAMEAYGAGSYRDCLGGGRCRGRLVTVWAPKLSRVPVRVGDRVMFASIEMHLPGKHNQDTHGDGGGGGKKTPSGTSDGGASAGEKAAAGLLSGRKVKVGAADLKDMMASLAGSDSVNLSRVAVDGEDNLFRKHARKIPRSEMPQLPTKTHLMGPFTDALAERGVKGEMEEIDPRELTATQSELDSAKVGQMYARAMEGTLNREAVAFVSRDGEILDGHHRWAALAAASASGVEASMKVIRLDIDIDTLLEIANTVSGPRKSSSEGTR